MKFSKEGDVTPNQAIYSLCLKLEPRELATQSWVKRCLFKHPLRDDGYYFLGLILK